jgi:uncharacterized OsmC-like protein
MSQFTIEYTGDLHCQAIHGPSGAVIETDAPVDNQGKGEAFSPTDLAATSLGLCMMTVMGIAAKARDINLMGSGMTVRKIMASDTPRRIARIEVDVTIPLPSDHPHRDLLENTGRSCPVALSLHPAIEQKITFHWQ